MLTISKIIFLFLLNINFVWGQIEIPLQKGIAKKFETTYKFAQQGNHFELKMQANIPSIEVFPSQTDSEFLELSHKDLQFLQNPGEAKVPFMATTVTAYPDDLSIEIIKDNPYILKSLLAPAQKEECRCESDKINQYIFNKDSYIKKQNLVSLQFLGKYRGQPMTRILVKLASSNFTKNETKIYSNIRVRVTSRKKLNRQTNESRKLENIDYLIVGPASLTEGLKEWIKYKQAKKFTFKIIDVEGTQAQSALQLKTLFQNEYTNNKFKYALIVGDATKVATNLVKTQWSNVTQSDYGFFLMDGTQDIIPDVQYGRIVANKVDEVIYQSEKWINYEREQFQQNRIKRMIGIASSEGDNPSDEEYVRSIESMLVSKYGTVINHFNQNDATSNPTDINASFNLGAQWLTYLGHGSGSSWGSTGINYTVDSIKQLANQNSAKPILIDVACQNGKLNEGFFGERMVNENSQGYLFYGENETTGAAMYYGGSVNISWHPPAIMAKGMVSEQISKKLTIIGDIILAGHLYLMNNYSDLNAVKDNFAWYHLFGDPGSSVSF